MGQAMDSGQHSSCLRTLGAFNTNVAQRQSPMCVCERLFLLRGEDLKTNFNCKMRTFLGNWDLLSGLHNFKELQRLKLGTVKIGLGQGLT